MKLPKLNLRLPRFGGGDPSSGGPPAEESLPEQPWREPAPESQPDHGPDYAASPPEEAPAPRRRGVDRGELSYTVWAVSILAGLAATFFALIYACLL